MSVKEHYVVGSSTVSQRILVLLIILQFSGCFQSSKKNFDASVEDSDIQENLPDGHMDGFDQGQEFSDPDPVDMPDAAEPEVFDILDTLDGEVIPGESWLLSLGGDDCSGRAYSLLEVRPGEYVFSGQSNCPPFGEWLGKFDARGRMIWQKSITEGGGGAKLMAQALSSDGYLYVGGFFDSPADDMDFWIIKLDLDGRILWQRGAGCGNREYATGLSASSEGGVVVCGASDEDGYDAWIMKLSPDGSVLWSKFVSYELPWTASATGWCSIEESQDGSIAIATGVPTTRGEPLDLWIMKLSGDGSLLWNRVIEGHWNGFATDLVETETGELVIVGGANFLGPDYDYDVWILTLSADGELLRQDTYGGTRDDWAHAVVRTADGRLIVGGVTESYGRGGKDMWLLGFDRAGDLVWQKAIGTGGQDIIRSMLISAAGRLIIAGEGSDGSGINPHLWLGNIGLDGGFEGGCSLIEETHASARPVEVTVEEPLASVHEYCSSLYDPDAPIVSLEYIPRYLCP